MSFGTRTKKTWLAAWGAVGVLLLPSGGCRRADSASGRKIGPATIMLRMPAKYGKMRRAPVAFDHGLHTRKLKTKGCTACHRKTADGRLLPRFQRTRNPASGDALMKLYHKGCLGCHKAMSKGPRSCGECHVKGAAPRSTRKAMHYDYGLHYRHVASLGKSDSCKKCHHFLDQKTGKLAYEYGKEAGCHVCHGKRGKGRTPSLRNAMHRECVGCHHQRRVAGQLTGPERCDGCHDAKAQATAKAKLPPGRVPRMEFTQPDKVWITTQGGTSHTVAFDHKAHESGTRAKFCTTCHHNTLAGCKSCHTLAGAKKGHHVTVATAYHSPTSKHSCVGCHRKAASKPDCAGCHQTLERDVSTRTCTQCHTGPRPPAAPPKAMPPFAGVMQLPPYSKEYPEHVVLKSLAKAYGPVKLPHGKIVAKLFQAANGSALARQFHGRVETLCAGCHHHAPVGRRPVACGSCHRNNDHATRDLPGLKAAYHRQCMGCHEKMGLSKYNGCTVCHEKAAAEGKR